MMRSVRYLGLVYSSLKTMKGEKQAVEFQRKAETCMAVIMRYVWIRISAFPLSDVEKREMVCRVFKNLLRRQLRDKMKQMNKLLEEPYRRIIISYLNTFVGSSNESTVRDSL